MSKKKNGSQASSAAVRKELDKVDRELLRLLSDRVRVAQRLAQARHGEGGSLYDPQDEDAALTSLAQGGKGPLDARAIQAIWREVQGATRLLVKPLRVAYLGPKYSYSHLAAISRFGDTPELTPLATIKAVFEAVHFKQTDFGVVPIENSTDGRIVDTLDMFARIPLQITGEVTISIHHNLLARCSRSEIVEVYSKPQAISQCREWLSKNLPSARIIEMTSTAVAAQIAVDKPGAAAVASMEAASHYGLNVVDANIEDNKHNSTRFAIIGGEPGKRTGADKTALMFEIPHKPGSLADAMTIFKRGRLNLTWIESFPLSGGKSEYLFFVELQGHQGDSKVKSALAALGRKTVRLNVLGSYPTSSANE
jgi:chorismate mutase/prephenate dehydratase